MAGGVEEARCSGVSIGTVQSYEGLAGGGDSQHLVHPGELAWHTLSGGGLQQWAG